MTKDEIIRLAESISINFANRTDDGTLVEFAEAVAAAEREACAKVCEDVSSHDEDDPGESFASAIRARSNKGE